MRPIQPGYIPNLLFELGHDASLHGLPGGGGTLDTQKSLQELTTTHITTLYYSALANQYLQGALPDDSAEVDDAMPRLRIAVERSYADFTLAANWLKANGAEFIETSPARQYYNEVVGMGYGSVKSVAIFYDEASE